MFGGAKHLKKSISTMSGFGTARRLPGDLSQSERIDRMIRVDHAGEYGACRIYDGQLAVLGKTASGVIIRDMKAQEERHLEAFERLVTERKVRPTLLHPVWTLAGFALGAGTALMGPKAAMACTIAVEEVIGEHYGRQAEQLGDDEPELRETIARFRDEELGHLDIAVREGGSAAPGYPLLRRVIQAGSRAAIWLSERI